MATLVTTVENTYDDKGYLVKSVTTQTDTP
jgi:hypothetical protein